MVTKKLSAKSITKIFAIATAILVFVGSLKGYFEYLLGAAGVQAWHLKYVFEKIDLDGENTIPAYYEGASLLVCALLLLFIAWDKKRTRDRFVWDWRLLSFTFLFLSLDEIASIHEMTIDVLRKAMQTSGIFHFAWVIPAGILLVLMGVMYVRFLWNLPARSCWLFIISGIVFISGAVGMEMVGGYLYDKFGPQSIQYLSENVLEEGLEMLGITLFIYSLLDYLERNVRHLALEFGAVSREQEVVSNYVEKAVSASYQTR